MDPAVENALKRLGDAVSAHQGYHYYVSNGRFPVHADNDPWDLVEGARLIVGRELQACHSLGLSETELEEILAEMYSTEPSPLLREPGQDGRADPD